MRRREEEITEKLAREMEQRMKEENDKKKSEGGSKGGRVPTMVGNPHQPHQQARGIRQKRQMMRASGQRKLERTQPRMNRREEKQKEMPKKTVANKVKLRGAGRRRN